MAHVRHGKCVGIVHQNVSDLWNKYFIIFPYSITGNTACVVLLCFVVKRDFYNVL